MPITVRNQRLQCFDLSFCFEYGLMRKGQIVKVGVEFRDAFDNIKWLQHVRAHKLRQAAHRLHRHRLMEQVKRLFAVYPEAITKAFAVFGKRVEYRNVDFFESLAKQFDIATEVSEIVEDRHAA